MPGGETLSQTPDPRWGRFPLLHDGLVAYWPFTNRANPGFPRETVSGQRPTSAVTTMIRDQWGQQAISFNGSTSELVYADSPMLQSPSDAITIYARVRFASLPSNAGGFSAAIIDKGYTTDISWGYEVSDLFALPYINVTGTVENTGGDVPAGGAMLNRWVSLFGRWASGRPLEVEGYYDGGGVAVPYSAGANISGTIVYSANPLYIGRTPGGTRSAMDCSQLAVWDRRLSGAELQLLATDPQVLFRSTMLSPGQLIPAGPLTQFSSVNLGRSF